MDRLQQLLDERYPLFEGISEEGRKIKMQWRQIYSDGYNARIAEGQDHLFHIYMMLEDVKAMRIAIYKTEDVANELDIRVDNIRKEAVQYLAEHKFQYPKPPTFK